MDSNEIRVKIYEFELSRAELAFKFAKFGFGGTLTAAISGMILILALAILDAQSPDFTFGLEGVLGCGVCLVISCIAFGALSLWKPIQILAKFGDLTVGLKSQDDSK